MVDSESSNRLFDKPYSLLRGERFHVQRYEFYLKQHKKILFFQKLSIYSLQSHSCF